MSLRTADGSQFKPSREAFEKVRRDDDEIVRLAAEVLEPFIYEEESP